MVGPETEPSLVVPLYYVRKCLRTEHGIISPYVPSALSHHLTFFFSAGLWPFSHAPSMYWPPFYLASDHPLEIHPIKRSSLDELCYNDHCSSQLRTLLAGISPQ